jgi:hypothetical protein
MEDATGALTKLPGMQESKTPSREVSKSCEAHEALPIVLMIAGGQVTVNVLEPAAHHHIWPEGKISGHSTYLRASN